MNVEPYPENAMSSVAGPDKEAAELGAVLVGGAGQVGPGLVASSSSEVEQREGQRGSGLDGSQRQGDLAASC